MKNEEKNVSLIKKSEDGQEISPVLPDELAPNKSLSEKVLPGNRARGFSSRIWECSGLYGVSVSGLVWECTSLHGVSDFD